MQSNEKRIDRQRYKEINSINQQIETTKDNEHFLSDHQKTKLTTLHLRK